MGVHESQLRAFLALQSIITRSFPATVPATGATIQTPWLSPSCWNFALANDLPTPQPSSPVPSESVWSPPLGPTCQGLRLPSSKSEWMPLLASATLADKTRVRASITSSQTGRDLLFISLVVPFFSWKQCQLLMNVSLSVEASADRVVTSTVLTAWNVGGLSVNISVLIEPTG